MILFRLLALPVTAPAAGIKYCLDKVVEFAEQQMYDTGVIRDQLLELHLELEEGRIGEEEFAEREAVLLARLREIREADMARAREESAESAPGEGGNERTVVIDLPEELR